MTGSRTFSTHPSYDDNGIGRRCQSQDREHDGESGLRDHAERHGTGATGDDAKQGEHQPQPKRTAGRWRAADPTGRVVVVERVVASTGGH
jgi:hypothetical protein